MTSERHSTRDQLIGADLLTLAMLSPARLASIFDLAAAVKADVRPYGESLRHKTAILIFEKPSLRTKVTFEVGIHRLGGTPIFLDQSASRLGERESIRDYGKNLERWCQFIVARVHSHRSLEELAEHARVPVINALSDRFHPCQALADLFTLRERLGSLEGVRLAFVGDGNNVCHSLMHAASLLGVDTTVVTPPGYAPAEDVTRECRGFAESSGATLNITHDTAAVEGHHAVYTDVWVSMGQADQAAKRRRAFEDFRVDAAMMRLASRGIGREALFMHCLPAQRGVEVTDEVIDSPSSVVYDQAANRLPVQNALMLRLLGAVGE
ncbi:MAG TPA: ornithine carbamoyltransferase [Phycisphaerales bacterium]|nr:ornithine carbamoyltransferase [Phycisphaerales bacterium]